MTRSPCASSMIVVLQVVAHRALCVTPSICDFVSGWGQWDAIREQILTDPLFRFDYYAKTRTAQDLRRRVEQLTRALEKELSKTLDKERAKRRKAEEAEEASFLIKQRALLPEPRSKRKGGKSHGKGGKKRRTR